MTTTTTGVTTTTSTSVNAGKLEGKNILSSNLIISTRFTTAPPSRVDAIMSALEYSAGHVFCHAEENSASDESTQKESFSSPVTQGAPHSPTPQLIASACFQPLPQQPASACYQPLPQQPASCRIQPKPRTCPRAFQTVWLQRHPALTSTYQSTLLTPRTSPHFYRGMRDSGLQAERDEGCCGNEDLGVP